MPALPSGRQVVLVHGDDVAVVVEVGGGLRCYEVGGEAVLDGYEEDEMCSGGRGQPLLPWPNRLGDGRYEFAGGEYQLALSEPEHSNAIHGLTRWQRWSVLEAGTDRVVMAHRLGPQPGWAWTLDLSIEYRLSDAGLQVCLTATNASSSPCPFGAGFHPYLRAPAGRVDDLVVKLPARRHYVSDRRGLPTGSVPVEGTPLDFRDGARIGDAVLDTAFSDLAALGPAAGADAGVGPLLGVAPARSAVVELWDPSDPHWWRRVWMDPNFKVVTLFSGDTLAPDRRRQGLAVEPMTAPANMLRSGEGMRILAPNEGLSARWGIVVSRPGGEPRTPVPES